ncbi:hypothetical protein ACIRP2_05540 [Streptomyces sp. NPDC101194]|uniref:hypothetical protein n=1 Tax=Streptomyces sp. NPDC101194 TaxID=3366127 RepID=UPI00382160CE
MAWTDGRTTGRRGRMNARTQRRPDTRRHCDKLSPTSGGRTWASAGNHPYGSVDGLAENQPPLTRRAVGLARTTERITRIDPDRPHPAPGRHHITVVEAGRTAYPAGRCPLDRSGTRVGPGDLDAGIDRVVADSLAAQAAVGAEPPRGVRSEIYVGGDDVTALGVARRGLTGSAAGPASTTASTLLGVRRFGFRGQLIELGLTAVLPAERPPVPSCPPRARPGGGAA